MSASDGSAEILGIDLAPEPPAWVADLVGEGGAWVDAGGGIAMRFAERDSWALISARVIGARDMAAPLFQERATTAYDLAVGRLSGLSARNPVRLWNFIPGILEPFGGLPHRYMVFNAGRFEAYRCWYRDVAGFSRFVATATGVGHAGNDLYVHCLGHADEGVSVENPRQLASYCYSARYGPRPPCFARATCLEPGTSRDPRLFVGGTASVLGEESAHEGIEGQIEETLSNLAAVVRAGLGETLPHLEGEERYGLLGCYTSLRAYYPRAADRQTILGGVRAALPDKVPVEMVCADLCRPELLVEIEGVAELGVRTGQGSGDFDSDVATEAPASASAG